MARGHHPPQAEFSRANAGFLLILLTVELRAPFPTNKFSLNSRAGIPLLLLPVAHIGFGNDNPAVVRGSCVQPAPPAAL